MTSRGTAFCLAEDRLDCETGLRLAILSLCRHCPGAFIYVYRPNLTPQFAPWAQQFPQVTLIPDRPRGGIQWNCKPQALKPLLERGHREAVWLDSDVMVTRDCRQLFTDLDERVLAIAQEPACQPYQGTALRTQGWGLEIGRSLPFTLNSAVLRVTRCHLPLLDRWMKCLADPQYVLSQTLPVERRPLHMNGDQEILNALLGSREFSDVPLRVFSTGAEIIHLGGELGYSSTERLRGVLKPAPVFMHAIAGKPWLWLSGEPIWSKPDFFGWHRRLLQELSPYVYEARQYRKELGTEAAWMYRRTVTGTILRLLGFGHFALRGAPLSLAAGIVSAAKKNWRAAPERPVSVIPDGQSE
jgi:hypothetical protein